MAFGVLGPVEAVAGAGPVALKGHRQRAVLARLLIARGRVVPVDRLVDDLWDDPPAGAVAALRTFVSDLRRALEPSRPARSPATVLVTSGNGYLVRAEAVDADRFESAVTGSAGQLAAGRAAEALAALDAALALWRGPAYAEVADRSWARGEIDRLDELRLLAVERRAEALLAVGRAAEAVSDLRAYAQTWPLREGAWQLLATALYRSERQGDALAVLRQARATLVAELGVDPGPGLRRLEADILAQAPHLAPQPQLPPPGKSQAEPMSRATPLSHVEPGSRVGPGPGAGGGERWEGVSRFAVGSGDEAGRSIVGRGEELDVLERAADSLSRPVIALVSGDAGAGKTALAEALSHRLAARGWTTIWAAAPEHEGAPVDWPWARDLASPAGPDPAVARFRLRQAAVARLVAIAAAAPVLLVADDLHWADDDTLDLLAALPAGPGRILVAGTYRTTDVTPQLTAALARFARTEPLRIYLGGLTEPATGELTRLVTGRPVDARTAALIHRRSGGNPFFVRELARLLAAEGHAALEQIPAGVRDVIRHRLSRLPEATQTVLRRAAVLGRDVDADVLAHWAGEALLDGLDDGLRTGFLTETDGRLRFAHILVRDTLYDDLSSARRTRWHAAAAEAIERLRPDDVAALAHHYARAGSRASAAKAAVYARAAAEQAERQVNPREAARLWQLTIQAHDRAAGGGDRTGTAGSRGLREDVRGRLTAVMGLGRALAVTDHLEQSRRYRAEAIATAEQLDDPELTADVIAAFDVPAVWARNDDEQLSQRIVRAAERALPAADPAQRSRLLSTIALELRGSTADRGRQAALEAEAIARATGDAALLAFALDARFMQTFHRPGLAPERARIGAELATLAAEHELVTFEVLGRLILLQSHCAVGDFAAADTEATAVEALATRYDLPLVGIFTQWYAALRLAVDGHDAEAAYRTAAADLSTRGMPGMSTGLLDYALLSIGKPPAESDPWIRLALAGSRELAAALLRALPEPPRDQLLEVRLCLALRAAETLGDRATVERLRGQLAPAAGELAGGATGLLSFGPVADFLKRTVGRPGPGAQPSTDVRHGLDLDRGVDGPVSE